MRPGKYHGGVDLALTYVSNISIYFIMITQNKMNTFNISCIFKLFINESHRRNDLVKQPLW